MTFYSNLFKMATEKRKRGVFEEDTETRIVIKKQSFDSRNCPYLDTINRNVLDFDFEKLCSVCLSHINVYACLICGKYFQGRGLKSHAYTHSVEVDHHVYLNLHTLKFYCLPDNYEVIDSSLDDIKYVLKPTFTRLQIYHMDKTSKLSRAYDGSTYLPGVVGLNNIKKNDYCNVILHAFAHVPPLRNYFLREENYAHIKRPPGDIMILLSQRFGELMRKMWNPRNFKAHVSPHEMLQAVVLCSKKKYQITSQGDPVEFMSWFLNALHIALNGGKKKNSSIVYKTFQGSMRIYSRKLPPADVEDLEKQALIQSEEYQDTTSDSPFLYLMLDIPPAPLFKDELEQNIIPQVPLHTLLSKFDGISEKEEQQLAQAMEHPNLLGIFKSTVLLAMIIQYSYQKGVHEYKTYKDSTMKKFELTHLPRYLLLCIKRFTKNIFFVEKNPTIVNFPVKNVDFREFLCKDPEIQKKHKYTTYDLMANIVHEGEPSKGTFRAHVLHKGSGKWYEIQDLHVTEILPQMITLSEAYIQIWALRTDIDEESSNTEKISKKDVETPPSNSEKEIPKDSPKQKS